MEVADGARCTLTSFWCSQAYDFHDIVVGPRCHLTLSSSSFRGLNYGPSHNEDRVAVCVEEGADATISGDNDFGGEYEWNVRFNDEWGVHFEGRPARSLKNENNGCSCEWCEEAEEA